MTLGMGPNLHTDQTLFFVNAVICKKFPLFDTSICVFTLGPSSIFNEKTDKNQFGDQFGRLLRPRYL